ncbi:MAG: hypothetical protein ACC628_06265 [Pirellulaceae bacterium]
MQHAKQLETVRKLVRETMQAEGVQGFDECFEKILLRDEFYCGRSFCCGGHRAVWFIEEHTIKYYGPDGGFLSSSAVETANLDEHRRAA